MAHPKSWLIEVCEAIERNLSEEKESSAKANKGGNNNKTKRENAKIASNHPKHNSDSKKQFYCSEHGKTPTHATEDCWTIKNRDKNNAQDKNHTFSNKSF